MTSGKFLVCAAIEEELSSKTAMTGLSISCLLCLRSGAEMINKMINTNSVLTIAKDQLMGLDHVYFFEYKSQA